MSIPPQICEEENCPEHGCIFCRIIDRKEPARIVGETDRAIAIFPLRMATWGHTLIIPKNHVRDLYDARWEDLSDVMWLAKDVALRLRDVLSCDMNLVQNTGDIARQTVHHIHFHLMPRTVNDWPDEIRLWPKSKTYESEKLDTLLTDLRSVEKETSAN